MGAFSSLIAVGCKGFLERFVDGVSLPAEPWTADAASYLNSREQFELSFKKVRQASLFMST